MNKKGYTIAYGPGLTVKDQPHRANDTASTAQDYSEYEPTEVGQVTVVGEFDDAHNTDLIQSETTETETVCVG